MARRARPIARVRLARSIPRVLAIPLLLILAGGGLAAAGLLVVGGTPGLAVSAGGALLVLLGILAAVAPLSVRVRVEESLVRVSWLFGRRTYLLTPGSLTRARVRGPEASRLRTGPNLGWSVGRAVLYDDEEIHIVRLARTPTVILVPTAGGRLAIATSNETHLIEALTRAAHARAAREEEEEEEEAAAPEPEAPPEPELAAIGAADADRMTGIGREVYEDRLARERAASAARPSGSAARSAVPTVAAVTLPEAAAPADRRRVFRRPSWARRRPSMPAMPPLPSVSMPMPGRVRALPIRRPHPSWLLLLVPLAGAGAAWAVGIYVGELPAVGSNGARLTALALVLSGPATTIGAIMARTWWPRTVGVVIASGVAASAFVARALLG